MREAKQLLSRSKWVVVALALLFAQFTPLVAATNTATAASICDVDTQGANDEPGQKDLTKMCQDLADANVGGTISISFNWDDIAWSGNNSGDGCALFDTDNDGNANYSLCVVVKGKPAAYQSSRLYSCSDNKADRCTNPTQINTFASICNAAVANTGDPFPAGDEYPKDTIATCTIDLDDVGGVAATKLIDVCSYPSQEPNSDPSDCVIAAPKTGKLEVVKVLSPTSDSGKFNLSIDGTEYATDVGNNGTTGEKTLSVGTKTVGETAGTATNLASYTTSIVCKANDGAGAIVASNNPTDVNNRTLDVTVTDGSDIKCIITNTRISGTITVNKIVQNYYGGTLTAASFPLFLEGVGVTSGQSYTRDPGVYTVTETQQTGYERISFTNDCDQSGVVNLGANQNKTCTVTNRDIQPKVKVIKTVVNGNTGSTLTSADFTMQVSGTDVSTTAGQQGTSTANSVEFAGSSTGTYAYLDAGSYTVTENETTNPGYSVEYSAGCSGTIAINQEKTCIVTNTAIAPTLTVKKKAINDNGGSVLSSAFKLYAYKTTKGSALSGGTTVTNGTATTTSYSVSGVTVGEYTLEEDPETGYTASATWTCSKNNGAPFAAVNSKVAIALGENVTCEITNNDDAAGLTLIKKLAYNYDGVSESDWSLTATGINQGQSDTVTGNENGVKTTIDAANTYNLTEASTKWDESAYTGAWSCVKDTIDRSLLASVANNSVTIANGENYTCTVTNTMKRGTLIVEKIVNNDAGGTATAGDFGFGWQNTTYNTSGSELFTEDISDDLKASNTVNNVTYEPGVYGTQPGTYTVTESTGGPAGYEATYEDCKDVAVTYGETQTCTITNTAIAPTLKLVKKVVNDNGGTIKANGFNLKAGSQSFTGANLQSDANGVSVTEVYTVSAVKAGDTIAITEDNVDGYSLKSIVCVDDQGQTVAQNSNQSSLDLNLALAQNVTCTLTNEDDPSSLTLIKKIANNYTGSYAATISDWQLTADGKNYTSGTRQVTNADDYALDESSQKWNKTSFTASKWVCDNGIGELTDALLTLGLGKNVTCEITNTMESAKIIVKKIVVDESKDAAEADDYSVTLNDKDETFFTNDEGNPQQGEVVYNVPAGTYTVKEVQEDQGEYATFYSNNCDEFEEWDEGEKGFFRILDGDYQEPDFPNCFPGDCEELVLGVGETITCTIENVRSGNPRVPVDLSIDKDDAGVLTEAGASFDYTFTVKNESRYKATNVEVSDQIPASLKVNSIDDGAWSCAVTGADSEGYGGQMLCKLAELNGNTTADAITVNVTVKAGTVGEIENTAVVEADQEDTNEENNTSTEVTPIKSINVQLQAICRNNFPYMLYDIDLINFTANQATFKWYSVTPGDDLNAIQATQVVNSTGNAQVTNFTGELLWPGASLAPEDWPGWDLVNGEWAETRNDVGGKLRPQARVDVSVNPQLTTPAAYPGANDECNPPQNLVNTGSGSMTAYGMMLASLMLISALALARPRAFANVRK